VLFRRNLPSNISAFCHVEEDAKTVWTDSLILKRILNNLASNAVQAMPNGGKLTLLGQRNAENFIVTVEDTGIGIPQDVHPKLFTPMFTTKAKGQGFGLVVVKRMTEALGGKVTFETEPGVGSKFHIHLPQTPK
jgi:signal transduction histidine kinase